MVIKDRIESEKCTHKEFGNGIHELRILESSRQAVDDMFTHVKRVADANNDKPTRDNYLIVVTAANGLPLPYLRQKARKMRAEVGVHRPPAKLAILYEGKLLAMFSTVLQVVVDNPIRFFNPSQRNQAIDWLLEP